MTQEQLFFLLQNPHHYTGLEINRSQKVFSKTNINICLVFPDVYEIGMSHQGVKLLYHLLNSISNVNAERCFLPDAQSISIFKTEQVPLFSLESRTELSSFDMIAFSLLSELNFTNLLAILDLANIPLLSEDRTELPIIAAGGISIVNPEPLRQFVDLFAFGDGEFFFPELIKIIASHKGFKNTKKQVLNEMNELPGCYVPSHYLLEQNGPFRIPISAGKIIKKQFIPSLCSTKISASAGIVPLGQVIFDRLDVEVARGCPNACRFCQARNYYSPYRCKSGSEVLAQIKSELKSTGFDTVSLASLSTGDHPDLADILAEIDTALPQCTAFSFPSLRPRTLSDQMLKTVSKYRRTGLTIVPEAGSERLRRVIGKDVTDQEIFNAVDNAIKNHWQKIKLYFMLGLPTETDEDINAITDLVVKIQKIAQTYKSKIELTLSFSTFVPKPHTPFQWSPRLSISEAKRRIQIIKTNLRSEKHIKLDFHVLEKGIVETILGRGDVRVGHLLLDAFNAGELFTAWDNSFHADIWMDLIEKHKLSFLLEELPVNSPLPWSFIQINQPHTALSREYLSAQSDNPQQSCFPKNCPTCGVCFSALDQKPDAGLLHTDQSQATANKPLQTDKSNKIRLFYEKTNDFLFFPHLAIQKYIERIIRISALPFRYSEGFHPRIKMAMLPPLPVFAQSLCECVELSIDSDLSCKEILTQLNHIETPLKFYRLTRPNTQSASLNRDLRAMSFSFNGPISEAQLQHFASCLLDDETCHFQENILRWRVSSQQDIAARFGKTYRILDPERKYTRYLKRESLAFYSDPPTEVTT